MTELENKSTDASENEATETQENVTEETVAVAENQEKSTSEEEVVVEEESTDSKESTETEESLEPHDLFNWSAGNKEIVDYTEEEIVEMKKMYDGTFNVINEVEIVE